MTRGINTHRMSIRSESSEPSDVLSPSEFNKTNSGSSSSSLLSPPSTSCNKSSMFPSSPLLSPLLSKK